MENPSLVDSFLSDRPAAPMGPRFVAWLIDAVLVAVIAGFSLVTLPIGFGHLSWTVWFIIVHFVYSGYFTSVKGATPGKKVMKICIIQTADGKTPNFQIAGLRDSIGHYASSMILFLGYICAFFTEKNVALHDIVFRTRVVRVKEEIHL